MTENTEQYWEQAWSREEMERLHSLLRERPFDKQEVLEQFQRNRVKKLCDVGCGFGFYASHFARAGFAVSGIDIAASSVQLTRQLLREQGCRRESLPLRRQPTSPLRTAASTRFSAIR